MSLFSHPIKKLTLLAAFGGGYVLGAKAGRERYEQIKRSAQQVADDPRVQQASAQAQELVRDTADKVKDDPRLHDVVDKVGSATKQAADTVTGKVEETVDAVTDEAKQADAKAKIQEVADAAKSTADDVVDAAKDKVDSVSGDTQVHPLLADEHVVADDPVVYTTGDDIEESIDELSGPDATEQSVTGDRGNA